MHPDASVVLITGASRGIGRAIAEHLQARGHGVVITGTDPDHLAEAQRKLGDDVLVMRADVAEPGSIEAVMKATLDRFGRLDALINNAGISGSPGMLWHQEPEAWWRVLEVNVRGPMLAMRGVLPHFIEHGSGTILNVGSLAAVLNPIPGMSGYPVSKVALMRLTEIVAEETREHGIGVFSISPGLVRTDMTRDVPLFKGLPDSAWTPISAITRLAETLVEHDCSPLSGRFIHVHDDLDQLLTEVQTIEQDRLYCLGMRTL